MKQSADIPTGFCPLSDSHPACSVQESEFPCIGKCFNRSKTIMGIKYQKLCQSCTIWVSLPDSGNLEVTAILECPKKGFGKRIKE